MPSCLELDTSAIVLPGAESCVRSLATDREALPRIGRCRRHRPRRARVAAERKLDAENRRFEVGMSTTLDQQVRQRELAGARNTELQAMIAYNAALITFERVQKIQ